MKFLAIAAACLPLLTSGCPPAPATTTCQDHADCPLGFFCDLDSHLCTRTFDAAVADAPRAVDGAAPDTTSDRAAGEAGHPCTGVACPSGLVCVELTPTTSDCVCQGITCSNICHPDGNCCVSTDCAGPDPECVAQRCHNTVTLRQGVAGYTGATDTWIDVWSPDANHGGDQGVDIRHNNIQSTLIRFDLGVIPADSTVVDAVLDLYCAGSSNGCFMTIEAFQVLRPWQAAVASWRVAQVGDPWNVEGCSGLGVDLASGSGCTVDVDLSQTWHHLPLTSLVQGWVDAPDDNHGAVLKALAGQCTVAYTYRSSDHPTVAYRPGLTIEYVAPR